MRTWGPLYLLSYPVPRVFSLAAGCDMGGASPEGGRHVRRAPARGWFAAGRWATRELYRRYGWGALVDGPLPGHRLSGCEQTALVVWLLSGGDRGAAEGAGAGIVAALEEIEEEWHAGQGHV